jgi:hypothetical protein
VLLHPPLLREQPLALGAHSSISEILFKVTIKNSTNFSKLVIIIPACTSQTMNIIMASFTQLACALYSVVQLLH